MKTRASGFGAYTFPCFDLCQDLHLRHTHNNDWFLSLLFYLKNTFIHNALKGC